MAMRIRTEDVIAAYIRRNSNNGILRKSVLDIADGVGYANATVHRTIRKLADAGVLRVEPARKANEPATIVYLAPDDEDEPLQKGVELANKVKQAASDLIEFLESNEGQAEDLEQDARCWRDLQRRLINVTDLPGGMQIITVRQSEGEMAYQGE